MASIPKKTLVAVRESRTQLNRALKTNRLTGYQEITLHEALAKVNAWLKHWDKEETHAEII